MPGEQKLPTEKPLREARESDIAALRKMAITDFAVDTYLARVQAGEPREEALDALLQGRSLSEEQRQLVRVILRYLSNGPGSRFQAS